MSAAETPAKKSAYTPGPWRVARSSDNDIMAVTAIDPANGLEFELCEVWGENNDKTITPMSRANARLIAAAPNMLAALAAAEQQLDYGQYDAAQDILRAAIAAAEGRAP